VSGHICVVGVHGASVYMHAFMGVCMFECVCMCVCVCECVWDVCNSADVYTQIMNNA